MTTYKQVCAAWPSPMPIPTEREAIAGVKRLIRVAHRHAREEGIHFGLRKYRYKITTGNRRTDQRTAAHGTSTAMNATSADGVTSCTTSRIGRSGNTGRPRTRTGLGTCSSSGC